jgi:hypothetical protein
MAQFFAGLLRFIAAVHAMSLEVFIRSDFGCRYASIGNLLFGILLTGFYSGLGGWIISALHHERISTLMGALYTLSICMCVWHRVSIWMKRRKGVILHTRYSGTSHFERLLGFTGLSEQAVKQYVEPIGLLVLAYLASCIHESAVSTWLMIGSFSIFLSETLTAQMAENEMWDEWDAMIETRYRRQAMKGATPKSQQGYSIAKSSIELMRTIPTMEQEPELSADVKSMLDKAVTA